MQKVQNNRSEQDEKNLKFIETKLEEKDTIVLNLTLTHGYRVYNKLLISLANAQIYYPINKNEEQRKSSTEDIMQ